MNRQLRIGVGAGFIAAALFGCEFGPEGEVALETATVDLGNGPVEIAYEEVDGYAIFEGDIILGPIEAVESGDFRLGVQSGDELTTFASLAPTLAWPNGEVHYWINPFLPWALQTRINQAISDWEAQTPIRFVLHPPGLPGHFVEFIGGGPNVGDAAGQSAIGFQPGTQQVIRLGFNASVATITHEIGHTVGFFHEQSRIDRDSHVLVNWPFVQSGREGNFFRSGHLDHGPYDFESRMQYHSFGFTAVDGVPTLIRRYRTDNGAACQLPTAPNVLPEACRIRTSPILSVEDRRAATRMAAGNPAIKYRIRNAGNGLCLRPRGGSIQPGADVITDTCGNAASRRWIKWSMPSEAGTLLINEGSRLCLQRTGSGSGMTQELCNGAAEQRFDFLPSGDGDRIRQVGTNRCVLRAGSTDQVLLSTTCTNSPSRRWFSDI